MKDQTSSALPATGTPSNNGAREAANSSSEVYQRLLTQLETLGQTPENTSAAVSAQEVLKQLGHIPKIPQSLYSRLVQLADVAAADLVATHLLTPDMLRMSNLWPWLVLHAATAGRAGRVLQLLECVPQDLQLPFNVWRHIVMACQNNQIPCGSQLRALFLPDLPDELSIAAILRHPYMPPADFGQKQIEKTTRMRAAMGLQSPVAFTDACRRGPLLNIILFTYFIDALTIEGAGGGRDCLLPFVKIRDNPQWSDCLKNARPFVLACFHAGPVVDGKWPARSAKVPLFHFAAMQGSRVGTKVYETNNMTPAEAAIVTRDIVRQPSGVILAVDLGKGLRDTGLKVAGEKLELVPYAPYLAYQMKADVFFLHSRWADDGIEIEIVTGPRATSMQSRADWDDMFNRACGEQIERIVASDGLNSFRF